MFIEFQDYIKQVHLIPAYLPITGFSSGGAQTKYLKLDDTLMSWEHITKSGISFAYNHLNHILTISDRGANAINITNVNNGQFIFLLWNYADERLNVLFLSPRYCNYRTSSGRRHYHWIGQEGISQGAGYPQLSDFLSEVAAHSPCVWGYINVDTFGRGGVYEWGQEAYTSSNSTYMNSFWGTSTDDSGFYNYELMNTTINETLKNSLVPEPNDPYVEGGTTESGGGEGDFDDTSDSIDFPSLPTLSAVDTGFITLFNPSISELNALASYMWSSPLFDLDAWKKVIADPMDAILGLSIVPVAVPDGGQINVTVGNISTNVAMTKAGAQYVEIDCGSINVNEYWGAYLDYAPYTKAEIYLPYCGIHALSIDDIMKKTVAVKYHIDLLSGACCAYVKCGDSVLYTFIGQCAASIPVSGGDWTNMINGIISIAASVGSMVATEGMSAPMAIPQLASTAVNAIKPNVEKSGAIGGSGGLLAIQKPYLILTRPKQALPVKQNEYTGYPSFITSVLEDLSGYTEVEKIHLENVPATETELTEIENLLKGGVIL